MRAAWYVSSHGWGHAARQRELIRAWLRRDESREVTLTTQVPDWFWRGIDSVSVRGEQPGPLPVEVEGRVDPRATAEALSLFHRRASAIVEREAVFLGEMRPDLVISDIDPVPFAAAERLGIPAWGIANFTWDWVFGRMLSDMEREVEQLAGMYSSGTYLRLPLGPPASPFHACRDVGLLPGGVAANPDGARELLGDGRACLVALRDPGRMGGSIPDVPGWELVSALPGDRFGLERNFTPDRLAETGVSFADLVVAADVVLCKPGYGMISQILCGGLRAVVLRRTDFPETPYLTAPLEDRPGVVLADAATVRRSLPALLAAVADGPAAAPEPSALNGDGCILNEI